MNRRITRRAALVAGASAAAGWLGGRSVAAPVPKGDDKSWVGKTVLPKKPDPRGVVLLPNPDGPPAETPRAVYGASWEAKAEKGTRVELVEGGDGVWIEKDLLVPLTDAVEFYTKALTDENPSGYEYNYRGWATYLLGKPKEAVKDFDEFLKLNPAYEDGSLPLRRVIGLSNRGLVLAEMGKFEAALKDLDAAAGTNHRPALLNRGWASELKGEYKKAAADYATLLAAQPDDALALNNMAWLKATCPNVAIRDGKEAVTLAKRACERTGNREGANLDTLAAAHAEAGDFAAAVKAQEQAMEDVGFAKKYGDEAQNRLQLYKDKQPYRSKPLK